MSNRDEYRKFMAEVFGRLPTEEEIDFSLTVPCGTCGAGIGRPCRWPENIAESLADCYHGDRLFTAHYNAETQTRSIN